MQTKISDDRSHRPLSLVSAPVVSADDGDLAARLVRLMAVQGVPEVQTADRLSPAMGRAMEDLGATLDELRKDLKAQRGRMRRASSVCARFRLAQDGAELLAKYESNLAVALATLRSVGGALDLEVRPPLMANAQASAPVRLVWK